MGGNDETKIFLILISFSLFVNLHGSSGKIPENLSDNNIKIYKEWINMGLRLYGTMSSDIDVVI
ncbi:MAG: hypothetical protein H0Z29_02215 [Candidatus Marinimicrobia bacterium]|nr:hypothetical protein [Candidatus Neomarinimicrobiota bacterium]